ncbi:MAG: nitroreductase [Chlamydiales bacterium]|jgi:nitroreductase
MNVIDAIKNRRATRHLDPAHKLKQAELRTLLGAIALAPTSFNMQNRHVVAVVDQEIKNQLQAAAWGQEHVRDASVVFVMAGDLGAYKRTDRYLRDADTPVREMFEPMVAEFYDGKPALQRDEAARSVGMAAMSLMLSAQQLGYESCPMIGFDPDQVSQILGLDAEHPPLMLVVVGKATKDAHPRLGLLSLEETVSIDRFGNHAVTGEADL